MIGIIIAGGIMAIVSAYLLFKVAEQREETNEEGEKNKSYKLSSSLQILFFFMIIASFIIIGSSAYESRNDCDYLLTQENTSYKYGNNFTSYHWDYSAGDAPTTQNPNDAEAYRFHDYKTYGYEYICTERLPNSSGWIYRLPLYLGILSAGYIIIYFLLMLWRLIQNLNERGGKR